MTDSDTRAQYTLWQMVAYMLHLGTIGFGGPVALIAYMHRDLVEERKWISQEDYKEGPALAQLAPGPLAAQLGIYMGYVHYRVLSPTLAGVAFVIPSLLLSTASRLQLLAPSPARSSSLPSAPSLTYPPLQSR